MGANKKLSKEEAAAIREQQEKRLNTPSAIKKPNRNVEPKAPLRPAKITDTRTGETKVVYPKKQGSRPPKNEYQSHFVILNNFVDKRLHDNLTATELKIWIFMLRHSKNGIIKVSFAKMEKDLGRCKDAISKSVNSLMKRDLIERLEIGRPTREDFTSRFSTYRLK